MEQQAPWDEIVRAWHDVAVPVAQTAAQYGMSASALMAAAKARGWPSRAELKRKHVRKLAAKSGSGPGKNKDRGGQGSGSARRESRRAARQERQSPDARQSHLQHDRSGAEQA